MTTTPTIIDFTSARTPLAVRQTLALGLGLTGEAEPGWSDLRKFICDGANLQIHGRVIFKGVSRLARQLPDEALALRSAIAELTQRRPEVIIGISIHD